MKITDLRIMRGPNFWSVRHPKIIVLKVSLEEYQDVKTNEIPGLAERLEELFPGMVKHRAGEGREGGFFKLVREGTLLTHVIEHIALELQTLGGMDCGYGRSYPSPLPDEHYVVFSYQEERAGEYAAHAALRVTLAPGERREVQHQARCGKSARDTRV